jgi:hypothetical protein
LLHPCQALGQHLLEHGDTSSSLHVTGFTKRAFWILCRLSFLPLTILHQDIWVTTDVREWTYC